MPDNIIQTFDLTKIYPLKGKKREIKALDNINLEIRRGETFGLLGPNGAGKTTLIEILTTLLNPTSGYALIDGYHLIKNAATVKTKIALMLESDMLYYRITAYDNLKFFCKIYNVANYKAKIQAMAEEFGIEKWLDQLVESLSSGMKMKVALCRTLLLERDILFLDEPTVGLDVKIINTFIDIIKKVKKTIIFTSHDLSVVEKICDRVAFIKGGQIIKIGTQDEVKKLASIGFKLDITVAEKVPELISELSSQNFILSVKKRQKDVVGIRLRERSNYQDLLKILTNFPVRKIKERELSLEKLFIQSC